MTFIVAIDGPAGTGKSSVARFVAENLGFIYVDTGAIYRALGYLTELHNVDPENSDEVQKLIPELEVVVDEPNHCTRIRVDGKILDKELRTEKMSLLSSIVSRYPKVRADLLRVQRALLNNIPKGAIFEGRDIGTVVFPNAQVKIYITANAVTRAKRRFEELQRHGGKTTYEEVLESIQMRDERDGSRTNAPMQQAADAIVIDSSNLSLNEVIEETTRITKKALDK